MPSKYVFKTTPAFRKALRKLTPRQKASAQDAFRIFKDNPFDPRLRTHKIHRLIREAWPNNLFCVRGIRFTRHLLSDW